MSKRSKLLKRHLGLIDEWMHLVKTLARYFVQSRPSWQRSMYVEDLEGDGYLALVKAARTYDPARLPYPKAYFARAILNSMLKSIKKTTRVPGARVSIEQAEYQLPDFDEVNFIRLAIEALPECDRAIAGDRFLDGCTIRAIALKHELPLRIASLRSRRLAKTLAVSLGIELGQRRIS